MLSRITKFLNDIGIKTHDSPGASGLVDGVEIRGGELHIDHDCSVSDLLHEAGHIAIIPLQFRPHLGGNLHKGMKIIWDELTAMNLHPDHSLHRAVIQASDAEATAWAWAAGLKIGLPHQEIIGDEDYQGYGRGIKEMLQYNAYAGINGLAHAGMCKRGITTPKEQHYPIMQRWVQN